MRGRADPADAGDYVTIVRPRTLRDLAGASRHVSSQELQDYLSQLRRLNDSIRLLDVRIAMLKERLFDYYRFPRSPFMVTIQNAELQLIEAQQTVRRLRRQRALMPSSFRGNSG